MGITIATSNRRLVLKTDDYESETLFNRIALELLGVDQQTETPVGLLEEDQETERHSDHSVKCPEKENGYSGFLYVECEHCDTVRGFCAKDKLSYYKCGQCGEKTGLTDMVRLYLDCECGKRSVYWTNLTDEAFDVNCIACGTPVAVKYNAKKKCYETIEG